MREWKLHFTWGQLLPPLILGASLFNLMTNAQSPFFHPQLSELVQIFEVFWPLALALGVAGILPYERQEGMLELRLSYYRPYALSLLQKLALPCSVWLGTLALGLFWSYHSYLAFDLWLMLKVTIPPAIALAGLALLTSALTLNTNSSLLVAVIWWGFELATGSRLSGAIALFPYSMGITDLSFGVNRAFLLLSGLLMTLAAILLLARRQVPAAEE